MIDRSYGKSMGARMEHMARILHCEDAADTLMDCICENNNISGGRKEELFEVLQHLLACRLVCQERKLMGVVLQCVWSEDQEINASCSPDHVHRNRHKSI